MLMIANGPSLIGLILTWSNLDWHLLDWKNIGWERVDWGNLFNAGPPFTINLPEIPMQINGDGTYANPWSVSLNMDYSVPFEILVWL